jgi:hypothetical protein
LTLLVFEQMHVIGHERPGMDRDPALAGTVVQPMRVGGKVLFAAKTDLAIVAALDDVLGNPCGTDPWQSCHASSLMAAKENSL